MAFPMPARLPEHGKMPIGDQPGHVMTLSQVYVITPRRAAPKPLRAPRETTEHTLGRSAPESRPAQRSAAPVSNGTHLFHFGPLFGVVSVVSVCVVFGPPLCQLARIPRERERVSLGILGCP